MPARYPGPPHYSGPPVRAYAPLAAPQGPAPVPVLTPLPAARSAGAQSGAKKARALWPWALAAGAALAGALTVGGVVGLRAGWLGTQGISRKLLVEHKLEPNPRSPVSVAVPGDRGKVLLPPGVVTKKSTLAVSAITGLATPPEAGVGNTLEVRLGDLTRFDEPVTIEIPYDPAKVLGRRGKRPSLLALTYDPTKRTWDSVPFSVDERRRVLLVDTTHLSMFSAVFPKPIQTGPAARVEYAAYPFAVDFADASTAQNILKGSAGAAAEEGWEASMEWFGIGQAVATLGEGGAAFASYSGAASVLGKLNDLAGNLGIAFALVQFGLDMSKEGGERVAVGNALRAIGMDAIGRWGTSAMKVAGVGVFFLDYSLNQFASTAWAGRKDLWARAFACYYDHNGRNHAQWLTRFKAVVSEARSPDAASAGIRDEVVAYSKNIWSADGSDLAMCQAELGASFLGSFGGLNEATKKDLSAEYARQLFADLAPELLALSKWATAQQQERTHRLLEELRGRYNQKTTLEVALKTKDPKRKLDAIPVAVTTRKDPERWRGTTDAKGVFTMEMTALGYMLYGRPTEVVATLPGPDGKPELRRGKLVYSAGKTRVEVDLDGVAGSFEGELNGTYTGPGLDGPVPMKGPIRVLVDEAGVAQVTFEVKTGFTAGRGMTTMASTTTGTATGRLEGTTLAAKGSVKTQMKVVVRLPDGREQRREIPSSSPVTLDATLVGSDKLEGKLSGNPGAKTLPFTATRR